ncbi:hypothetical protein [Pseudomonas lini]|uniref:hypothetical protein n=1 Tax=Pseudomonas lini TaxID=163011 RepID=UPI00345EEF6F
MNPKPTTPLENPDDVLIVLVQIALEEQSFLMVESVSFKKFVSDFLAKAHEILRA